MISRRTGRRPAGRFFSLLTLLTCTLGLLVAGCSDALLEPDDEQKPARLEISTSSDVFRSGDPVELNVEVLNRRGNVIPDPPGWATSNLDVSGFNTDVLRVDDGRLVAVGPGQSDVDVVAAGLEGFATVRVNPNEVTTTLKSVTVTQSTQRDDNSVPLVAGRDAAVRIALEADAPNFFRPAIDVTITTPGAGTTTVQATANASGIPQTSDRTSSQTYVAIIPGAQVGPGMEISVDINADDTVPITAGSDTRFPASGTLPLDVRELSAFGADFYSIRYAGNGATGNLPTATPEAFMQRLVDMFPIGEYDGRFISTYTTEINPVTSSAWGRILNEFAMAVTISGGTRYSYGLVDASIARGAGGIAYIGGRTGLGIDRAPGALETYAHEVGHSLLQYHAPCGDPAGVNPEFPYDEGGIGEIGYNVRTGTILSSFSRKDLMTYCDPTWISDYTYQRVFAYRLYLDGNIDASVASGPFANVSVDPIPPEPVRGPKQDVLVVWGQMSDEGLVLEPAFTVDAPSVLPAQDGPYRLQGRDASGAELFSLSFAATPVAHGASNERSFVFAIPADQARADRLDELVLSGPAGTMKRAAKADPGLVAPQPRLTPVPNGSVDGVELQWSRERHAAVLIRDAETGQVLTVSRGGRVSLPDGVHEVEATFSNGVQSITRRLTLR